MPRRFTGSETLEELQRIAELNALNREKRKELKARQDGWKKQAMAKERGITLAKELAEHFAKTGESALAESATNMVCRFRQDLEGNKARFEQELEEYVKLMDALILTKRRKKKEQEDDSVDLGMELSTGELEELIELLKVAEQAEKGEDNE